MKKIVSIFCVICILISIYVCPVHAAEVIASGNVYEDVKVQLIGQVYEIVGKWSLDDEGVFTLSGSGALGEKENFDASTIGNIETIIVEEGVTEFTIESYTAKKLSLPSTVENFIYYDMNSTLEEITVSPQNEYFTVIDNVLYDKDVTYIALYPEGLKNEVYKVPETVLSISEFYSKNLKEIVLHDKIVSVFLPNISLEKLIVPESVEYLCADGTIGNSINIDGLHYLGNESNPYLWLLKVDSSVKDVNISEQTKHIAQYSFMDNDNITSINFPDNVESVSFHTLLGTYNKLETITLGKGITYLPSQFIGGELPSFKNIYVSENLKTIDMEGLARCYSLFNNLPCLEDSYKLLYIGTKENPYHVLFPWNIDCCTFNGENLVLPNGIKSIGETWEDSGLFPNIVNATIPKSLTYIGENAFSSSAKLTDIYYDGTIEDWNKIEISKGNDPLTKATLHCKNAEFNGLSFENQTYTYDGTEKTLKIEGTLPEGATVAYTNNEGTNAGTYNATAVVSCEGYNTLTLNATMKIEPAQITVTAKDVIVRKGESVPEFNADSYSITAGILFNDDELTGKLLTDCSSTSTINEYSITQGTLTAGTNYNLTFIPGKLSVIDKTPQNIVVDDIITERTYGDATFKLTVIADETSKLDEFTYESDNTSVATVDAEGNVTIVGVGKANIIVKQAGNEEYAAASASKEFVVNKKNITLSDIDSINKTATFEGVLESDAADVSIDFDKIDIIVNPETSKVVISNFVLIGNKSPNYILTTTDLEKDVIISEGTITAPENVTITVQKAEGTKTVIVETIDVSALPEETEKVELDMTENGSVDTVSFPKTAFADLKDKADLEIKLTDGIVKLNKLALAAIEGAANGANVSLKVAKLGDEQLNSEQVTQKNKLTNPVVFGLELGGVTDSLFDGGQATVTVSYEKAGSGNVKAKYLKADGTTEAVSATYDDINKKVAMALAHFSEYVVYTEPQTYSGGGGGGVTTTSSYTVNFETNGAETIKDQSIKRNGVVSEPITPVKEGFEFDGWYTDKEFSTKYDFANKVTKSFTLYAKWVEIKEDETEKTGDVWKEFFVDVKADDWFYSAVKYAVDNKLMNGVTDDKFAPKANLTRAMLVTILYRAEGEPDTNKSIPFADIELGSWYANAVTWAAQNGIVNGTTETTFAPNNNITREQIATIIYRYAIYKGMDAVDLSENLGFADSDEISEYAISAMNWAVGSGLIAGKTATTLNPHDNATRAEIATILMRFLENNK